MIDKSIIMSLDSVRAILAGVKTQTRRVVSVKKIAEINANDGYCRFPYSVGDVIYVKEAWARGSLLRGAYPVIYRADYPNDPAEAFVERHDFIRREWRNPMFMPKAAARIWLRITRVRVERLQEISDADAWAEGILAAENSVSRYEGEGRELFAAHWDKINGKRKGCRWADNPHVWIYEFERVTRC